MIKMNMELFKQYALEGDKPVMVEFWAPRCSYCRRIEPAMAVIYQQFKDKLLMAKVNIDEEPLLAKQEQIEAIPALVIYRHGEALSSIVAPQSKAEIDVFIEEGLMV